MSPFKVEQMMFLKLNQGCLPEVKKYNAVIDVIAAQQERRSQCLQDVQSAQRGGCWGDGGCINIEELVRSGECMPKVEGMGRCRSSGRKMLSANRTETDS